MLWSVLGPLSTDNEQSDEERNGDPMEQVDIHALDKDVGKAEEAGAPEEEELEPQSSSSSAEQPTLRGVLMASQLHPTTAHCYLQAHATAQQTSDNTPTPLPP